MENKDPRDYARGHWQRYAVDDMVTTGFNPDLRGRAKSYMGRYERSLANLVARLEAAGFSVRVEPGPKGGTCFGSQVRYYLD